MSESGDLPGSASSAVALASASSSTECLSALSSCASAGDADIVIAVRNRQEKVGGRDTDATQAEYNAGSRRGKEVGKRLDGRL